jgi:hypothetical protein
MRETLRLHNGEGLVSLILTERGLQVVVCGSEKTKNIGNALNELVHAKAFHRDCGHLNENAIIDFIVDREADEDHIDYLPPRTHREWLMDIADNSRFVSR